MNYKKYIRHRAILFGSVSSLKAAQRITKDLEAHNVARYGNTLYEQAYNYYQVRYRKQTLLKIIILVGIVLPMPLLLVNALWARALLAAYYTALSYYMRKE